MKLPRVSILAIMTAVVVIAVDCMAVRFLEGRSGLAGWLWMIVWGSLPMANLLAIGLASRLWRAGRRPFQEGFLLFGAIATIATIALIWLRGEWVGDRMESILAPLLSGIDLEASPVLMATLQYVAFPAFFLLPQLLLAVVGGVIGRIFLGRSRGEVTEPSISPRPRLRPLLAPLVLVVLPVLAVEAYLRWKVDPAYDRLPAGSVAVYDPGVEPGFSAFATMRSVSPPTETTRVRIEGDDGIDELGAISGPRGESPTRCVRRVRVTLLDGRHAGESSQVIRCLLRAAR